MTKMEQMKQAMDNYLDNPNVIPMEDDHVAFTLGFDLFDDELDELLDYYLG